MTDFKKGILRDKTYSLTKEGKRLCINYFTLNCLKAVLKKEKKMYLYYKKKKKVLLRKVIKTSDRPKQDFMAETEPKPNFGYNSSFGRNRNTKEIEINDFVHYKKVTKKL